LVLSIVSTKFYISVAKKFKLFSVPHDGGVRKDIIPTSGGISFGIIYLLIVVALSMYLNLPNSYFYSILLGSGLMLSIGFLDDIFHLSSSLRLLIQFIFVLFVCLMFGFLQSVDSLREFLILIIIIFGSIWIINTFNFIDGADGLVATNSAIFSLVGGFFLFFQGESNLALLLFSLFATNIGFLYFNWSPAKLFMGDSGSLFLGSVFIIFIIGAYSNEVLNYWTWLIMLSIFYVETTVTLLVRIKRRENALKVHHSHHAYQQIIISTGKHNRPALISIIIQSVWLIPMTLIASKYPEFGFLITLIVCLPLSVIFYFFGPYKTK
tara:strand:- start:636 stop:1604 length:969 start_codon:yes stop_codon:yes gene_type:complete